MTIHRFHIPAEATRREYSVYIIVARHRQTKKVHLYVGKTGDNREGCNPLISRAGNHLSFNSIHSQSRNHLGDPENYDFKFFFTPFGAYVHPAKSRVGIDLVNEMERQLNLLAQTTFGEIANPLKLTAFIRRETRQRRTAMATPARLAQLTGLVNEVKRFIEGNQKHEHT